MTIRKLWPGLLLAILLACAFSAACGEEAVYKSGDYSYTLNLQGEATITDWNGDDTSLSVPDELDGHSVTVIGDGVFSDCIQLESVTVPDSVTAIGKDAFISCSDRLILTVGHGSYAETYARENDLQYMYPDSLDWLNE